MRKPHEQSASEADLATPTAEGGQSLYGVSSDYSLPVSWNSARLEDLAIKIQDGTHFSPKSQTGSFRYLTSKHIRFGYLDIGDCGWISHEEHREIFRRCDVAKGDVLLTKDGANTGNAALNSLDEPFSLLSSVAMIRCNPTRLHAGYLLQYLLSPATQKRLKDAMSGNAISRVTLEKIKALRVIGPQDTNEQRRIAAVLDTADEAIAKTEAMLAKLKQVRAGLLHDLLTRGLDEHGQLRDPIAHPEQFQDSPLGRIPCEWEVRTLMECVHSQITYGIVQAGPHIEGGVPYIRTGDMAGNELRIDGLLRTSRDIAAAFRRSEVHTGEIVCAIRATLGKVLEVPPELDGANLTQGTARIAPKHELNSRFVLWALQTDATQRQFRLDAKGTTFPEITLGNLRQIRIAIPKNREEQDRIVQMIDAQEKMLRSEEQQLSKLQSLKSGLMTDLLTGRVRVPEEAVVAS